MPQDYQGFHVKWKMERVDKALLFYSTFSLSKNFSIWIGFSWKILFEESFSTLYKFENTELMGKKTPNKTALQTLKLWCFDHPLWSQLHAWCLPLLLATGRGHLWTASSAVGLCSPPLNLVQTIFHKSHFVFIVFNIFSFVFT